jgi:hypothetical protein
MDKYTAFNLYRSGWTTQGAAVAVPLEPDGERHDVYLASDVEALLKAAKDVCYYDWSDNDEDAVRAVEKLRSLMERSSHD